MHAAHLLPRRAPANPRREHSARAPPPTALAPSKVRPANLLARIPKTGGRPKFPTPPRTQAPLLRTREPAPQTHLHAAGMDFIGMLGASGVKAEVKLDGVMGTPLWWAAQAANNFHADAKRADAVSLAMALIGQGADVNAVGTGHNGDESSPLWWAVRVGAAHGFYGKAGTAELVKLLVEKGADVNAVGKDAVGAECTPLWLAAHICTNGSDKGFELATLLVEKGADVNAVGKDAPALTPPAPGRRRTANCRWSSECTPLWLAAEAVYLGEAGALELATLLVQKGADTNAVGSSIDYKCTPLWLAGLAVGEEGNADGLELATLLVENGATVNAFGKGARLEGTPLWLAAHAVYTNQAGGVELATLLVEKGATVNAFGKGAECIGCTPLWFAAHAVYSAAAGAADLAMLLVQKGADVNAVGKDAADDECLECTPLWLAGLALSDGEAGGLELATLLVEKDADVNAFGIGWKNGILLQCTPLWLAAHDDYYGMMDSDSDTPDTIQKAGAAKLAKLLVAKLLVAKGANVNAVGSEGTQLHESSPLWWAARAGADYSDRGFELAVLLVTKGADVNAVGKDARGNECAPLHWAAMAACDEKGGAVELATLLVEKGADVKAVGKDWRGNECTPLWLAAHAVYLGEAGAADLAMLLVQKGADANAVGRLRDEGCTPLWWAALAACEQPEWAGAVELATLLVEQGADVNTVGKVFGNSRFQGEKGTLLRLVAKQGKRGGRPRLAAKAVTRLLVSAGARLADDEKEWVKDVIDTSSSLLYLTLRERTATSLTVSWPGSPAVGRCSSNTSA